MKQARMSVGLVRTQSPVAEPLTVDEAKAQCRVENDVEDAQFSEWITAARERAEAITGQSFITQTHVLTLDFWPDEILLAHGPIQAISSITYLDNDGERQTWVEDEYRLVNKKQPPRIVPAVNCDWPNAAVADGSIEVTFIAGYGLAGTDVPAGIKAAMKLMIAHWYLHREDTDTVPKQAMDILSNFRSGSLYGAA
ncbi:MAG: phage head-tail connector protein [Gemmataceae bacterium]